MLPLQKFVQPPFKMWYWKYSIGATSCSCSNVSAKFHENPSTFSSNYTRHSRAYRVTYFPPHEKHLFLKESPEITLRRNTGKLNRLLNPQKYLENYRVHLITCSALRGTKYGTYSCLYAHIWSLFYLTNTICHLPPLFQRECGPPIQQIRFIQTASRHARNAEFLTLKQKAFPSIGH